MCHGADYGWLAGDVCGGPGAPLCLNLKMALEVFCLVPLEPGGCKVIRNDLCRLAEDLPAGPGAASGSSLFLVLACRNPNCAMAASPGAPGSCIECRRSLRRAGFAHPHCGSQMLHCTEAPMPLLQQHPAAAACCITSSLRCGCCMLSSHSSRAAAAGGHRGISLLCVSEGRNPVGIL